MLAWSVWTEDPAAMEKIDVFFDSGIRRGLDVLKALCLGAIAVLIGRPIFWGLCVDGENGIFNILKILETELDIAMAYLGVKDVSALNRSFLSLK